jgi:hypothetical protein
MQILGHTRGAVLGLAERLRDCNVRLRWGGEQVADAINGKAHLHNGLEQLQAFTKANVPTIQYTTDPKSRDAWAAAGQIVLGRSLNHTQGLDIVWPGISAKRNIAWNKRDFWTIYKPAAREWRVHIVNGHSIARGLKHFAPEAGDKPLVDGKVLIRSRRLGWHMRHDVPPPKGLRDVAKAAVAAVGYDLGAVDILQVGDGKTVPLQYFVLEVNSRPAIRDEYTLAAYEKALRNLA